MPETRSLMDEALEAWRYAREGVIAEADNIPRDHWTFRPTAENRDVAELVRHILEAGLMAVGELARPDGDFARQDYSSHIREHAGDLPESASPSEWLRLLRQTLDEGTERMRRAGEEQMLSPIRQFNGDSARRLTWFHHHVGHEEYHRGQLALYARLTGQVPALTQRIETGA